MGLERVWAPHAGQRLLDGLSKLDLQTNVCVLLEEKIHVDINLAQVNLKPWGKRKRQG